MGYENHIFCAADLGKEEVVEIIFSLLEKVHDFWKVYCLKFGVAGKGISKDFSHIVGVKLVCCLNSILAKAFMNSEIIMQFI